MITAITDLLWGGLGNLAAYLAAHVLLCLLPAFYIAGAMTALIPKEMVTRYLGRNTPKFISYPAAAAAGVATNPEAGCADSSSGATLRRVNGNATANSRMVASTVANTSTGSSSV